MHIGSLKRLYMAHEYNHYGCPRLHRPGYCVYVIFLDNWTALSMQPYPCYAGSPCSTIAVYKSLWPRSEIFV